jgi:hypothetical protein
LQTLYGKPAVGLGVRQRVATHGECTYCVTVAPADWTYNETGPATASLDEPFPRRPQQQQFFSAAKFVKFSAWSLDEAVRNGEFTFAGIAAAAWLHFLA